MELLAVQKTLKSATNRVKSHLVLVKTDNSTVVSYINRQGGYPLLFPLHTYLEPTHFVHSRQISLQASHREGEHHIGCPFTKESNPNRMVPPSPRGQADLQHPRQSTLNPFASHLDNQLALDMLTHRLGPQTP